MNDASRAVSVMNAFWQPRHDAELSLLL